jgi:lipopolysaccharide transport system ATP-binding protein
MPDTVISVEHLSKAYRLGQIGTGTLTNDLNVWWARVRGKPNPLLKIGQQDRSVRPSSSGGPSSTKSDGRSTVRQGPLRPTKNEQDTIWALKDVSFEVKMGEVLGIIGRNGAGKSTLLKIITGVTAPTSGQIKAKGRVASLLEVGTGFHPELTGRENTYLNGAILGMTKAEVTRKFDEIVAFSEVEQFIDTPVKRYSSGMYVRLAFAVAAHLEPEILLVDEVLAVGDAEFQKKCLGKMGDIAEHGRTVLFVSHNMTAVRNLCGRVLLLGHGGVTLEGDAASVVAGYIGQGLASGADIDFSRLAHSGSGEAKIVGARLTDVHGEPASQFYMDDGMAVRLSIEAAAPGLKLTHAVEILDSEGLPIYHFWDIDEQEKAVASGSRREVVAYLPALELYPGGYSITLWIGRKGTRIDRVENCLSFSVKQPDHISREFSRRRGVVFKRARWVYGADLSAFR